MSEERTEFDYLLNRLELVSKNEQPALHGYKSRRTALFAYVRGLEARAASPVDAQLLAERFHETYERLAPDFGYETRPETRKFDPESPNGKLMIAVCAALASASAGKECAQCVTPHVCARPTGCRLAAATIAKESP